MATLGSCARSGECRRPAAVQGLHSFATIRLVRRVSGVPNDACSPVERDPQGASAVNRPDEGNKFPETANLGGCHSHGAHRSWN